MCHSLCAVLPGLSSRLCTAGLYRSASRPGKRAGRTHPADRPCRHRRTDRGDAVHSAPVCGTGRKAHLPDGKTAGRAGGAVYRGRDGKLLPGCRTRRDAGGLDGGGRDLGAAGLAAEAPGRNLLCHRLCHSWRSGLGSHPFHPADPSDLPRAGGGERRYFGVAGA